MKRKLLWMTETAIMLALLVTLQALTKGFGQLVTGTCVNAVLAVSVLVGGLGTGLTVAVVSPVLAFLLGSPANELVVPIAVLILTGSGGSEAELLPYLSLQQSLCMLIFTLFHWPCTTTLWTIYKETHSLKWTALAWLLPTAVGLGLCFLLQLILPA